MKSYRYLIPLFLVFLTGASIYMLISEKEKIQKEYQTALESARNYTKYESKKNAITSYMDALDIRDSIELWLEIGEMYHKLGTANEIEDWGEDMITAYPEDPKAYEFLMRYYIDTESYASFYQVKEEMEARHVSSQQIQELLKAAEWKYYFHGTYTEVKEFSGGYAAVREDENWGCINETAGNVIPMKYKEVGSSGDGIIPVVTSDGQARFIDSNGENYFVLDESAVRFGIPISGVFTVLNQNGSMAFYNFEGKKLSEDYEDATSLGNGYGAVKTDGNWKIIDNQFRVIGTQQFLEVIPDQKGVLFRNERAFVKQEDGIHMINTAAEYVTDQVYEDAVPFFSAAYAAVKVNQKWQFINAKGEIVSEKTYDDARSFSNGYAAVCENGLWGFINEQFEWVIEPQFNGAMDFTEKGTVLVNTGDDWECLMLYRFNYS